MLKLLLVDEHELIRAGLKQVLYAGLGELTVGEARNVEEAVSLLDQQAWDLIITDIKIAGGSGPDVFNDIKAARPEVPVLVLSQISDDEVAIRVLKCGAAGFLHKDTSSEELIRAVRKVLNGGRYLSPELAEKLAFRSMSPVDEAPHRRLSDREYVVLKMLASGTTLTQIGRILQLSIKTISTYRTRILQKLQLTNNAELTRYALRHRLVE